MAGNKSTEQQQDKVSMAPAQDGGDDGLSTQGAWPLRKDDYFATRGSFFVVDLPHFDDDPVDVRVQDSVGDQVCDAAVNALDDASAPNSVSDMICSATVDESDDMRARGSKGEQVSFEGDGDAADGWATIVHGQSNLYINVADVGNAFFGE